MFQPSYGESYALLIGIDEYRLTGHLNYAVNDARAVSDVLQSDLSFRSENVVLLLNGEASRERILQAFLAFSRAATEPDDRLLVFFAGHGHTETSWRGEVGYLVPVDGTAEDLSTLLRWDDLTKNADLILAKHVLFIMDACYGGLAVTRKLSPGSMRFLQDMLLRVSRQVLTAGKANEVVADDGGPVSGHSVFTGHLLLALKGGAKDNKGNLTANGIFSYVYQAVSGDPNSEQTPHYGYLYGDGDMIFHPLLRVEPGDEEAPRHQELMTVPVLLHDGDGEGMSNQQEIKRLLSEPKFRIELHDHVAQRTREVLSATGEDFFSLTKREQSGFEERLHKYEQAVQVVLGDQLLLARWGRDEQLSVATIPVDRLAQRIDVRGGQTYLLELRWYPVCLLLYASCFGAVLADNYSFLHRLFHLEVPVGYVAKGNNLLLVACLTGMQQLNDVFKSLPGHERFYVPRSEYLLRFFQPMVDETLFVGSGYEALFDRVEVLIGLEYAHIQHEGPISEGQEVWAPLGRFGWRRSYDSGVLERMKVEAAKEKENWPPSRAGLFGGSYERFVALATGVDLLLAKYGWRW